MYTATADEGLVGPVIEAYKIYPDGRRELVRNVEITGLSQSTFKEIMGATADTTVYTVPFPRPRPTPGVAGTPTSGRR